MRAWVLPRIHIFPIIRNSFGESVVRHNVRNPARFRHEAVFLTNKLTNLLVRGHLRSPEFLLEAVYGERVKPRQFEL